MELNSSEKKENYYDNSLLVIRFQGTINHIWLLPEAPVSFGRDKNNDVKLALFPLDEVTFQWATADISRKHFVIEQNEGKYFIEDHSSTNGTSVDCIALHGQKIQLKQDQVIDVGGVLDLKVHLRENSLWLHRITNMREESYLLFNKEITIGKSLDSTIFFENSSLSPCHLCLTYKDGFYYISKQDQEAKVMMNTIPLELSSPRILNSGDQITIGEIDIAFKPQRKI